jgi:AraC family transcriptional regulator
MGSTTYRTRIYGDAASVDFSKYHLFDREVAGCKLTATAHPARFAIPRHAHECASFFLVVQGSFTEQIGAGSWECRPLSFVFTPPGDAHEDSFHDRGGRCLFVQLAPAWLDRVAECGSRLDQRIHSPGGPISRLALLLYGEAFRSDQLSGLVVEGLLLEILAQLIRQNTGARSARTPRWVGQIEELLRGGFTESLTLEQIARQVGVHPVHLATTFKRHCGETVGEYIRRLRVEFAARKLSEGESTLAHIALAAGFVDHSHFCRTFKRATGMTPGQYREHTTRTKRVQATLSWYKTPRRRDA